MDGEDEEVQSQGLLTIRVTQGEGDATVSLEGEFDLATTDLVEETLRRVEGQVASLVIDLHQLSFIDSTAVGVLIEADARSRENSHRLCVRPAAGQVEKVLALTGLAERLHFV